MMIKRIACILVVVALVAAGLSLESKVLVRKDSAERFAAFYGERTNVDVLFLGNSHVLNAVATPELWNEFGITAYNLALPGGRVATSYWALMAALQNTKPRLVVLDCSYMSNEDKVNRAYINVLFDAMPMSPVRVRAAFDLLDDPRDIFEMGLFPFARYHSRWAELEDGDWHPDYPSLMGYSLKNGAVVVKPPRQLMAQSPEPVQSVNMDYLDRIIRVCRDRDIRLLLTYIPFREGEQEQNEAGYLGVVAADNGLDYLTPTELGQAIDWDADFRNGATNNNSHMNHSGARKLTRYIGQYIAVRYSLPDHRSEAEYAHWSDDYRGYLDYEDRVLRRVRQWKRVLSLLGNERYALVAAVNDPSLWADDVLAAQMKGVGLDAQTVGNAPALYLAGKGATTLRLEPTDLAGGVETPLGQLGRGEAQTGGGYAVTLNGDALFTVADDAPDGLQIAVLDRRSGALVRSFGLRVDEKKQLAVISY